MPRIKYFNLLTNQWEYADSPFGSGVMKSVNVYLDDANSFLTVGTIKTGTSTLNLPYNNYDQERWGALLYLQENDTDGTGMQIWCCIAYNGSLHRGEIWKRVVIGGKTNDPTFGTWEMITKPNGGWTEEDLSVALKGKINGKQDSSDTSLETAVKNIVGAINEVNSIAKGANQALVFSTYQALITAFNALGEDEYVVGQNAYVVTREALDLWISSIETTSVPYTYVDDEAFVSALETDGYVQVGYYRFSALETQKVDLSQFSHETWTFTLSDSTTVDKEVVVWNSQA